MSGKRASLPEPVLHSPKRPRKSILKQNPGENNTVPLASNGKIVDLQVKSHDRRVSFAENVHLREIDVVSYHSETPASGSSEDFEDGTENMGHQTSSDIESSDFDEDVSFSEMEARVDQVLPMLRTENSGSAITLGSSGEQENTFIHESKSDCLHSEKNHIEEQIYHHGDSNDRSHIPPQSNDNATDEDSDVPMDFTGPISRIIPRLHGNDPDQLQQISRVEPAGEAHDNDVLSSDINVPQNESNKHDENHASNENLNNQETDFMAKFSPPRNHAVQSFALGPGQGEETPLSQPGNYPNEPHSADPEFEFHHMNSFVNPIENENIVHSSNYAPSLTSSEDLDDAEEDMQLTSQIQTTNFTHDEVTMDLTAPQAQNLAFVPIENVQETHRESSETTLDFSAIVKASENGADIHSHDDPNTSNDGVELSQNRPSHEDESKDEVTMEFTKPVQPPSVERDQTSVDEITMDFTSHVDSKSANPEDRDSKGVFSAEQENSNNKNMETVFEDEEEPMELTQTVGSEPNKHEEKNSAENSKKDAEVSEKEMEHKASISQPTPMSPIYVESQDPAEAVVSTKTDSAAPQNDRSFPIEIPENVSKQLEPSRFEESAAETVQTPTNKESSEDESVPFRPRNAVFVSTGQTSRNSSTSSSSSDINVFATDMADDNIAGNRTLGPAMNPSPPKRPKLQNSEISQSHLTDPKPTELSYDTQWDVPSILLPEFLQKIGVTFFDDLAIPTKISAGSRRSISRAATRSKGEYFKANVELPILQLYELNCRQLAQKIQEGKESFEEGKRNCVQENPPLFKQFLSSSPSEQVRMQSEMHLMKQFTKQQAQQIWFAWRKDVVRDIVELYQNKLEVLENDKELLVSSMKSLDRSYAAVRVDVDTLRLDLQKLKNLQATSAAVRVEDIQKLKTEMTLLNENLKRQKKAIHAKEKSIAALRNKIDEQTQSVVDLKSRVSQAQDELNKTKRYNKTEIEELHVISLLMQACAGLKYVSYRDNIYEFALDTRVRITIDSTKLDTSDGLACRVLDSGKTNLLNEELLGLMNVALNENTNPKFDDVLSKLQFARKFWRSLQMVDCEIFSISTRYAVKFHEIKQNALSFSFEYLSLSAKLKIDFLVSISADKIMSYPAGVNVQSRVLRKEGARDESVRGALAEIGKKLSIFTQISHNDVEEIQI